MNFNTYEDYIDSNIEWFSSVPKHWNLIKIKHLINYYTNGAWGKEKQNDINDIICIRIADFNYPQRNVKDIDFTIRNIPLNNKLLLKPGDLLIEKSGGGEKQPVGRVVLFDKDIKATFSNFISKLKIKSEYNSNYLCYVFNMLYSSRVNTKSIKQTTGIQNLDSYAYFDEIIAIPQINEQKQIANYLDNKTAKIDKTIENNQKLIELLEEKRITLINQVVTKGLNPDVEMKDSRIEWIGEIPEHWGAFRIKDYLNFNIGGTPPTKVTEYFEGENIWISIADINSNEGDVISDSSVKISDEAIRNSNVKLIHKGSLLYSFKLSVGLTAFAGCDLYTNEAIASFEPNEYVDLNFLKYVFNAGFENNANVNIYGAKLFNSDLIKFSKFVMPFDITEQKQIANYLDNKISKIDKTKSKIEKQINLLKEYKESLIYHVVTGKVDVRGEDI